MTDFYLWLSSTVYWGNCEQVSVDAFSEVNENIHFGKWNDNTS